MTIRLGPLLLAMLALVAIVVGLRSVVDEEYGDAGKRLSNNSSSASMSIPTLQAERAIQSSEMIAPELVAPVEDASFSSGIPPDIVTRLTAETASADPQLRAKAISALAKAPKSEALPVLRDVLTNGEPSIDRPLALQALRDLALDQGDDDGAIRSAVREVIYHGDDDAFALSAQGALEIIEESEMQ
jgi:HEAT repeat protein